MLEEEEEKKNLSKWQKRNEINHSSTVYCLLNSELMVVVCMCAVAVHGERNNHMREDTKNNLHNIGVTIRRK